MAVAIECSPAAADPPAEISIVSSFSSFYSRPEASTLASKRSSSLSLRSPVAGPPPPVPAFRAALAASASDVAPVASALAAAAAAAAATATRVASGLSISPADAAALCARPAFA